MHTNSYTCSITLGAVLLLATPTQAQLVLPSLDPSTVNTVIPGALGGANVSISNVSIQCQHGSLFNAALFNAENAVFPLNNGVVLSTSRVSDMIGPNDRMDGIGADIQDVMTVDIDLALLAGAQSADWIYGRCALNFDVIPDHDSLVFDYVFASEEYGTHVCTEYLDAFGILLSGPGMNGPYSDNSVNLATVPGGAIAVGVNTVNSGAVPENANGMFGDPYEACIDADPNWEANTAYFINNGTVEGSGGAQSAEPYASDPQYIQPNGFTTRMTASAVVTPGATYHAKLTIGNVDWYRQSALFLAGGRCPASLPRSGSTAIGAQGAVPFQAYFDADGLVLRSEQRAGSAFALIDAAGKELHRFTQDDGLTRIGLPGLQPGVYFLRNTTTGAGLKLLKH